MVVGTLQAALEIPFAQSLKDKRRVLSSLKAKLGNRFNVSVAETDFNEVWNRAEIGVALVTNDAKEASRQLSAVSEFIGRGEGDYRIEDLSTEILHV